MDKIRLIAHVDTDSFQSLSFTAGKKAKSLAASGMVAKPLLCGIKTASKEDRIFLQFCSSGLTSRMHPYVIARRTP